MRILAVALLLPVVGCGVQGLPQNAAPQAQTQPQPTQPTEKPAKKWDYVELSKDVQGKTPEQVIALVGQKPDMTEDRNGFRFVYLRAVWDKYSEKHIPVTVEFGYINKAIGLTR